MRRLFILCFFSLTYLTLSDVIGVGKVAASPVEIELEHYQAKALVTSGQILSLDASLAILNQYCQGQLIDAHLYQELQKWRYDLQIKIQRGQIINLSIDATTGHANPDTLPSECQAHETVTR